MKEYIERAAIEKFIEDGLNNPDKNKAFGHDAIEIMAEVHYMQAADVVEVVRCRECRHSSLPSGFTQRYGEPGTLSCHFGPCNRRNVNENDFCSYGQRKIEDAGRLMQRRNKNEHQ